MWQSKPPAGIQVNHNHPLAQGLVGCWLFNEGEGLRANDLCNNNHGVLTNFEPMSSSSGWMGGRDGTALMFDGVNDYVNITNSPSLNIPGELSLEAFINSQSSALSRVVAGKGRIGQVFNYLIRINTNDTINFLINGLTPNQISSTTAIIEDKWNHIVGVYGSNKLMIYIDGVRVAPSPVAVTGTPGTDIGDLIIGKFNNNTSFFIGQESRVRLWNRALSDREVQRLYSNPYEMFWSIRDKSQKNLSNEVLM